MKGERPGESERRDSLVSLLMRTLILSDPGPTLGASCYLACATAQLLSHVWLCDPRGL